MIVLKGICGFFIFFLYMELCIVTFVFPPGSDYTKVRQYKGVVVDALHVKKLLALQNLNTVIHAHHYFNKYPVTLIQALHVYGKYVSSNWKRLHYHCLLCRKPFFSAFSVAFFSSPYNPDVNWEFVYPQFTAVY